MDTLLRIRNIGGDTLAWNLAEVPSVGWLSETPVSGRIGSGGFTDDTVNFDATSLSPGVYRCTLRITSNDSITPTVNVPIQLTVTTTPVARIWWSPSGFRLALMQGQSRDTVLVVGNSGDTILHWSLAEVPTVSWMSENPIGGNVNPNSQTNIAVRLNATGLSPGVYRCTLRIASSDTVSPSVDVPVELAVTTKPAQIWWSPSSFSLTLPQGQTKDTLLIIGNRGSATLSWNVSDYVSWLSEKPASGSVDSGSQTNDTVRFNSTGLVPATYRCSLRVTSNDPVNPTVYVPVQLAVTASGPATLSGTIYDIVLDTVRGVLDSMTRLPSAEVRLLQGGVVVRGPVQTDTSGRFSFSGVPAGAYTLSASSVFWLPQGIPGRFGRDTVCASVPISLSPGSDSKDVRVPTGLFLMKYRLMAELSSLDFPIPEWGIVSGLGGGYDERACKSLVDSWGGQVTPQVRDVLARLALSEVLIHAVYDDAARTGAETGKGLADLTILCFTLLTQTRDVTDVLKRGSPLIGHLIDELNGLYLSVLFLATEDVVEQASARLPAPLCDYVPAIYSNLTRTLTEKYADLKAGNRLDALQEIIRDEVAELTAENLVTWFYVYETQPAVDNAVARASALECTGDVHQAFINQRMLHLSIAGDVDVAVTYSEDIRTAAWIYGRLGDILSQAGNVPSFEYLKLLGGASSLFAIGGYVDAIYTSGKCLYDIPPRVYNGVTGVFHPLPEGHDGVFPGYPTAFDPPSLANQLPGLAYDSLLRSLQSAVQSGDTIEVARLAHLLPAADQGFEAQLAVPRTRVLSVARLAVDSVPGFEQMYDSMAARLDASYRGRYATVAYLLAYLGDPTAESRDLLATYLDTLIDRNATAMATTNALSDTVTRLGIPAAVVVKKAVLSPAMLVPSSLCTLAVVIGNAGSVEAHRVYVDLTPSAALEPMSAGAIYVGDLAPGAERELSWVLSVRASAGRFAGYTLTVDSSDAFSMPFTGITSVDAKPGWEAVSSMPVGAGKKVRDGGALCTAGEQIYAFKGNNTCEYYMYDAVTDRWTTRQGIPLGTSGKRVKGGAALCSDGANYVYATRGNSTLEFWRYDIESDSWTQLDDVPVVTRKKVKAGTGLTFAVKGESSFVYCLKASNTPEFYCYYVEGNTWLGRADAPLGLSAKKYDKGSCLTIDGRRTTYALKGKYNEFYAYDVERDSWTTLSPLPLYNSTGKKKKAGDGACIAFYPGSVWCLKGGNTQEFWCYDVATDSWYEIEAIPREANRKKVKSGGALCYAFGHVYALKGNNTLEFWRYTPGSGIEAAGSERRAGGVAARDLTPRYALALYQSMPSPFRSQTCIRYSLPRAGRVFIPVYDVSGRQVRTLVDRYQGPGVYTVTWDGRDARGRDVAEGVYFCALNFGNDALRRKLLFLR